MSVLSPFWTTTITLFLCLFDAFPFRSLLGLLPFEKRELGLVHRTSRPEGKAWCLSTWPLSRGFTVSHASLSIASAADSFPCFPWFSLWRFEVFLAWLVFCGRLLRWVASLIRNVQRGTRGLTDTWNTLLHEFFSSLLFFSLRRRLINQAIISLSVQHFLNFSDVTNVVLMFQHDQDFGFFLWKTDVSDAFPWHF